MGCLGWVREGSGDNELLSDTFFMSELLNSSTKSSEQNDPPQWIQVYVNTAPRIDVVFLFYHFSIKSFCILLSEWWTANRRQSGWLKLPLCQRMTVPPMQLWLHITRANFIRLMHPSESSDVSQKPLLETLGDSRSLSPVFYQRVTGWALCFI